MTDDFDIIEELGGTENAREILFDFYTRVFDDIIIGFLFANSDKAELVTSQLNYVHANLGNRAGKYTGPTIRAAHQDLPITSGMFDRRHQLLRDTLRDHNVPTHITDAWLRLDASLRSNVTRWGADHR